MKEVEIISLHQAPKATDIWIGLSNTVRKSSVGYPKPLNIASNVEALYGRRGPLVIHLCGDFYKLPQWERLHKQIVLMQNLTTIIIVLH